MATNDYTEIFKARLNYTGEVGDVDLDGLRSALKTLKDILRDHDDSVKDAEEASRLNCMRQQDLDGLDVALDKLVRDRDGIEAPRKPDMPSFKSSLVFNVNEIPDDADDLLGSETSAIKVCLAELDNYVKVRDSYLRRLDSTDRQMRSLEDEKARLTEEGPRDESVPEFDLDLYHEAIHDVFEAMGLSVPDVGLTMPDEEDMQPIIDWANHYALDRRWQQECRSIADRLQDKDGGGYETARTLLEFTRKSSGHFAHPDEPEHGRVLVAQDQARSNLEVMGLSRSGYVGLWNQGPRDDSYVKMVRDCGTAVFAFASRK